MRKHPVSFAMLFISFNPRPAVRPGDAAAQYQRRQPHPRFNPRPAVRPGDAPHLQLLVCFAKQG